MQRLWLIGFVATFLASSAWAGGGPERRASMRNDAKNAKHFKDTTAIGGNFSNLRINVPDGHEVLRRQLRGRGLSGSYDSMVFTDWRGNISYETERVLNFWHADGRWHYKTAKAEWTAEKLVVTTLEGHKITVRPSSDYEPTRVQMQSRRGR